MNLSDKRLLYFGPLAVAIEWLGIIVGSQYGNSNLNNALSTASVAQEPLPIIFGITLTLASLSFIIFTFPLRTHWQNITVFATVAGVAFIATGWVPDRVNGNILGFLHSALGIVAVIVYGYIVWKFRDHTHQTVRQMSRVFAILLAISMVVALLTLLVFHRYIAVAEIAILIPVQIWVILVTYHYLKVGKLTKSHSR